MCETPGAPLTIRCEVHGDTALVLLAGELDLATDGQLTAVAASLLDDISNLVIDLAEVEFLNSTGLAEIAALSVLGGRSGVTVVVRAARANVRRVFQITGFDGLLAD